MQRLTDWTTTCVRCEKSLDYKVSGVYGNSVPFKVGGIKYLIHSDCSPPQWGHERKDDLNREADCHKCKLPITERYPEGHLRYYVNRTPEGSFPIHEKCRKK